MLIYCIITYFIAVGTQIESNTYKSRDKFSAAIGIIFAPISVPICIGMVLERIYQKQQK